jgi:small subunit ribosomal protein S3
MAHKVNPKIFRVGITEDWDSGWFSSGKKYQGNLREDLKIRQFLGKTLGKGIVDKVKIERAGNKTHVIIKTSKPGVIIGRGGEGVEILSKSISKLVKGKETKIDIEEVKEPSLSASIVAQQIAMDVERRVPYRRAVKRAIERILQKSEAKGLKVIVKGRLNGAEIARSETFKEGKLPLQTLRSDIDYTVKRARCAYGTVSVKVWLYKGEKI